MIDKTQPLWMPAGSVFDTMVIEIVTLVLGFYFGSRAAASPPPE